MKKTLLLLIFFSLLGKAQIYTFNHLATIQTIKTKDGKETKYPTDQIAINSENSNYILNNFSADGAFLTDIATKKGHKFFVQKSKEDGQLFFKYEYSTEIKTKGSLFYNINKINADQFFIQIFWKKNKRKIRQEIKITLEESSVDLYFLSAHLRNEEEKILISKIRSLTDPAKKYIVKTSEVDHKNYYTVKTEFKKIEKINLTFKLPENLIYLNY